MVYGSHLLEEIEDAKGYGWSVEGVSHDWPAMITAKNKELDRLHGIYVWLLESANVEIIDGRGTLVDAHTVAVGDRRITAERIMIAVGGWPTVPEIPGVEHAITSNEALELPRRPERVVIVGGGYIAVEFAGIFNAFGCHVDLVFRADKVLRGFDEDMRDTLGEEMAKKGVNLRPGCLPERIERSGEELIVHLNDGTTITCDDIMYATGRAPNTAGLGLAEAGVALNAKGAVQVDEWGQTSLDSVYAVGDVTDRINLTPVAIAEGRAFSETVYNNNPIKADHENVPAAVFSQPPVCGVGLAEHEARARYGAVDIYVSGFRPMKYTLTENPERGLLKLIVDQATDRVVGAHMVGMDAPEIIQGLAIAIKMGATKAQFDATVGIHPTAAEEFVTMREKRAEPEAKAAE
jgi:glutathione reductase (NADPH)